MGKHEVGYARIDKDHYLTPKWVMAALDEHVNLAGKMIWEPAAGTGSMAEALKAAGARVCCSDIANYGYDLDALVDFTSNKGPKQFSSVVTNPPYGKRGDSLVPSSKRA